jgi:hypothetical protein
MRASTPSGLLLVVVVLAVGCTGGVGESPTVEEPAAGGPGTETEEPDPERGPEYAGDGEGLPDDGSPRDPSEPTHSRAVQRCRGDLVPPIEALTELLHPVALEEDGTRARMSGTLADARRAARSCRERLGVAVEGERDGTTPLRALARDTRELERALDELAIALEDDRDPRREISRLRETASNWERSLDQALSRHRG